VIIKKVYARSQTPTGIAIAIPVGMQEYEPMPRTGKLVRFVLDIDKSSAFLAQAYKEGLAEWEKDYKKQERQKRKKDINTNEKVKIMESTK